MTEDQKTLLLIKGAIADTPEADQVRCKEAAAAIRAVLEAYGDHGVMALALVGAELQVAG